LKTLRISATKGNRICDCFPNRDDCNKKEEINNQNHQKRNKTVLDPFKSGGDCFRNGIENDKTALGNDVKGHDNNKTDHENNKTGVKNSKTDYENNKTDLNCYKTDFNCFENRRANHVTNGDCVQTGVGRTESDALRFLSWVAILASMHPFGAVKRLVSHQQSHSGKKTPERMPL
jgi:hypothetical protein